MCVCVCVCVRVPACVCVRGTASYGYAIIDNSNYSVNEGVLSHFYLFICGNLKRPLGSLFKLGISPGGPKINRLMSSGIWFWAYGSVHMAPGICLLAYGSGHMAPGIWLWAYGSGHRVLGLWLRAHARNSACAALGGPRFVRALPKGVQTRVCTAFGERGGE